MVARLRFIVRLLLVTKRRKGIQPDVQHWKQQELMWVIEFQVVVTINCRLYYLLTLLLHKVLYGLNIYSTVNKYFGLGSKECGYGFFQKYVLSSSSGYMIVPVFMRKEVESSKISVHFYQTTRVHVNLRSHRHEKLKSYFLRLDIIP